MPDKMRLGWLGLGRILPDTGVLVIIVPADTVDVLPALTTTTGVPLVDIWLGLGRILLVPCWRFWVMIFIPVRVGALLL